MINAFYTANDNVSWRIFRLGDFWAAVSLSTCGQTVHEYYDEKDQECEGFRFTRNAKMIDRSISAHCSTAYRAHIREIHQRSYHWFMRIPLSIIPHIYLNLSFLISFNHHPFQTLIPSLTAALPSPRSAILTIVASVILLNSPPSLTTTLSPSKALLTPKQENGQPNLLALRWG